MGSPSWLPGKDYECSLWSRVGTLPPVSAPPHHTPPFSGFPLLLQAGGQAAVRKGHLPPGHVSRGGQARAGRAAGASAAWDRVTFGLIPPALGAAHPPASWAPLLLLSSRSGLAFGDPGFGGSIEKADLCLSVTPPRPLPRRQTWEGLNPARRHPALDPGTVNPTPCCCVARIRKCTCGPERSAGSSPDPVG